MAELILLHGWGMNARVFDPVSAALADCRPRALDLPGHGGSPPAAGTLDAWADAIAAHWTAAHWTGPANVLGWSLGGQVALRLAARHPECVARLILLATTPCFVRSDSWEAGIAAADLEDFGLALQRDPLATLLRFLTLQTRGAASQKSLLAGLRRGFAASPPPHPAALADGLDLLRHNDLRDTARALRCPTLVIHGGRDVLTPLAAGEWLAQTLHAHTCFLPAAAHAPQLSHPDAVAAAIRAYVHAV